LPHVRVVYHGTPQQSAQPCEVADVKDILAREGVSPTGPVILLPGRLQPWKGQQVLIAAFPAVLKACPQAHAVILGGALFGMNLDYPDQLRRQINALSLAGRVHLVGHQPVQGWLERAAVVVHASVEPDPFPNVCIEALTARRPLITNTLSGTREILTHGVDALVIEPNDPAALAAALIKLLTAPHAAAQMADAGYRRYLATCTPSHMVRPIEATLASLLNLPATGRSKS
jgi:glycosyltransferase involved in cell wall biosynthesis